VYIPVKQKPAITSEAGYGVIPWGHLSKVASLACLLL